MVEACAAAQQPKALAPPAYVGYDLVASSDYFVHAAC